jgi:hypothetical protein
MLPFLQQLLGSVAEVAPVEEEVVAGRPSNTLNVAFKNSGLTN